MKYILNLLLTSFFILGTNASYAQSNSLWNKPIFDSNLFLNENLKVNITNIDFDKQLLQEAGISENEIEKFTSYYKIKIEEYAKKNSFSGRIVLTATVTSVNEKQIKKNNCIKNPTLCSLTSVNFNFENINKDSNYLQFYNYLVSESKKDNMEILISNFSFSKKFKLELTYDLILNDFVNDPKQFPIEKQKNNNDLNKTTI